MKRRHKYNAEGTYSADGLWFPSKAEARHYAQLKLLERAGDIRDLRLQPTYPVHLGGEKICTYRADFSYNDFKGHHVVDVKGFKTPLYKLKKKLVEAVYGITIEEVR